VSLDEQQRTLRVEDLASVVGAFTRMNIRLPRVQRMSFTTLSVLHTLATSGPKRLTELASSEQVTQPAATQVVIKLEGDGLVQRRPDPSDGRASLVHITPAGAAVVAARRVERLEQLQELTDQLTSKERAAIADALPALSRLVELNELRSR
jgi:DNA-binding MarR family transcriptional regulator